MSPLSALATLWEVGDECVVLDPSRVWRIAGFLGTDSSGVLIADLVPVGFEFNATHSAAVTQLSDVPAGGIA